MQPPQIDAHLRKSLTNLLDIATKNGNRLTDDTELARRIELRHQRRKIDYHEEVKKWYAALPPAMRNRRFSIAEICRCLQGRYRDRPAARMVAAALRMNGFMACRDWTAAGRNSRYWLPPQEN
jgi:hypothetical protein